MPVIAKGVPSYKPAKDVSVNWDNFRRGLNTLMRETELAPSELAQADNLILVGSGVPSPRWGSQLYSLMGETGCIRSLTGYYKSDGTNEMLSLTDDGLLTKKSGASYSIVTGASWVSGYDGQMVQLNDKVYIANGVDYFKNYDGTNINSFTTLAIPTTLTATNISGATGTFSYSWRVSAENDVGETVASTAVVLGDLPQNLSDTVVRLNWATSTPTPSVKGYVIYGREAGNETFLSRVDKSSLTFDDDGSDVPAIFSEPPTGDSTGGPVAKYLISHDGRMIMSGISGMPSRVIFTGKDQNSEKFHWSQGGGYIDIDIDSGDNITGLGTFQNKIIIFKERSIWELSLTAETVGNWTLINPVAEQITSSHGCISMKTVVPVENDVFFLTRSGVYVLGYEPNILNTLRTNEVSAKIRPSFSDLTYSDLQNACAGYIDKKYVLSFPTVKKTYVYDRERMGWMGPWSTPTGVRVWYRYYDSVGAEKFLAGENGSPYVDEFSSIYTSDKGTAFTSILRSRKENFGDWTLFKTVRDMFLNFKNIQGSVDITIKTEQRNGAILTAKSFTITTTSSDVGWGSSQWADNMWADSEEHGSTAELNDLVRWILLNKTARSIQLEVRTDEAGDDYELLGVKINARPQAAGSIPSSWKV